MRVRCDRLFPGRVLAARLAERVDPFGLATAAPVLELDAGAPVQLEPPCAVEVVEATPDEVARLREAGYAVVNTADAEYDRGCASLAAGAYDEAIAAFGRALALNPRDAQAYFNRGYAFAMQLQRRASVAVASADGSRRTWLDPEAEGLRTRAVADFTEALACQPGMAKAHGMRAEMYWAAGQTALARADYEHAVCLGDQTAARLIQERFGRTDL